MKSKKMMLGMILMISALILAACGTDNKTDMKENEEDMGMDHSSSGDVPDNLKKAENPTYEIGSKAIVETDHMEGMQGAEATIVGAYDTTAYVISYTPTTGGEKVEDHKWVIQEEIENADDKALDPGTEVTIRADHMEGMEGATAAIESAESTTVYMIDYTSTTDGEKVSNHKWVTESELSTE
ncbi:hypothetical protein JOC34_002209 [Virgibacillus halotolerans]|uniref:YdhK family protein n=1 Tax=Virgibacillus halotolerans TaxID=1071053 RepID=UPI001960726A|nr:YdhK family protein [Virgibacillus halotolerans]MBM7599841.1 hypothetical protein [Virgibacillus halotolerans]